MKTIITGGARFIGSHLVEKLLEKGCQVTVLDDLSTGFLDYLPKNSGLTFIKTDISNWAEFSRYLACFSGIDCVFHLAAIARIQPAILDPSRTHEVNVTGVFNILEAMRITGVKNIVYSSSSSVYGLKNKSPLVETMPTDCLNPYSVSKRIGELYCETWGKLYGIRSVALRYFNVYGKREVLEGPYAPVIGLFFKQAVQQKAPMTIVGDGEQKRDFTHVSDVAKANILAFENIEKANGSILNIGTGENYSVNEVAKMVGDVVGYGLGTVYVKPRLGESRETLADVSLAKNLIKYSPTIKLPNTMLEQRDYYFGKFTGA